MTNYPFSCNAVLNPFELRTTYSGLHIGHAEVPAHALMVKTSRRRMTQIPQCPAGFSYPIVIGKDHAAFAGRYDLIGEEAETADIA